MESIRAVTSGVVDVWGVLLAVDRGQVLDDNDEKMQQ